MKQKSDTTSMDMTEGSIVKQIFLFAFPLMLGNIFQMFYNTVDSIVVGNFVSTEALAAVGATTMITNMAIFFFNGFSVGAGVVIGQYFGARELKKLHEAIETTMAFTFILCAAFTVFGTATVGWMLRFMSTPADVFDEAASYLKIYMGGISGLLIYNIGSGILRAVGDSKRPLYFLILTSLLNTGLDLLFVLAFHWGIAGVAIATIVSQFISAVLILLLLSRTHDIYRLIWKDLRINPQLLSNILKLGLPAGFQSVVTAFSNVFVQSYINFFGKACMAGWASYNKLDQFIMLPITSMAMASTTFVSQNAGAGKMKRINDGTVISVLMSLAIVTAIASVIHFFASPAVRLFTSDKEVIRFGVMFLRQNVFFLLFNCVNHVLAGALRGRGDSTGPMVIMLLGFVAVRQTYLFFITHYVINTASVVGFGYPMGWMATCVMETIYFVVRWKKPSSGRIIE